MKEYSKVMPEKYGKCKFSLEGMPEPYLGDPTNCEALMININPGGAIDANDYKHKDDYDGNFIHDYISKSAYRVFASEFPYITKSVKRNETDDLHWMEYRRRWLHQFNSNVDDGEYGKNFVNLELCPWHSKKKPNLNWTVELKKTVQEYVLDFACAIIKNNQSKQPKGLKYGFIIGKTIFDAICKIDGWECVMTCEVTDESYDTDNPVKVYEEVLRSSKLTKKRLRSGQKE